MADAREVLRAAMYEDCISLIGHKAPTDACPRCDDYITTYLNALSAAGLKVVEEVRTPEPDRSALMRWDWPTRTTVPATCAGCGGTIVSNPGGFVFINGSQWFHSPECAKRLAAPPATTQGER